jgi:outer membrane protein OmpA-like peptidoglycan-associated protein
MRCFYASVIVAAAFILGACAQTASRETRTERESAQWKNAPQPIEPEAVQPGSRPARNDVIVLLPKANGSAGAVVVYRDGGDVLLNKPYAAARIQGPGQVQAFTYDSAKAKEEFGATLTALPGRPATFLLYFFEGTDQLTPESEPEIGRIFSEISARPDPEVTVIGHTDAVGTLQYNDELSLQRAQRVRDELFTRGIPGDRMEVEGRGKREPLIPTSQGVSEPQNRRVEIIVR